MLPKNLKYGSKVESAYARSYRTNIAPQNGTSYSLGSASSYRLDSVGMHALVQRIRIFHGSNLLQDIDNYGLLAKMLFDLQMPTDACYGKQNILTGCRSDLNVTLPATSGIYVQSELNAVKLSANQINSGILLGSLCPNNYIPLFAATSAPLRVEIQLVDSIAKLCACTSATGTISMTSVEYVANFIELGDNAISMIYDSLQGSPLQFVVPDYRNYQFSYSLVQNVQTGVNIPIPAKFSSLKSLFVMCRDQGLDQLLCRVKLLMIMFNVLLKLLKLLVQ